MAFEYDAQGAGSGGRAGPLDHLKTVDGRFVSPLWGRTAEPARAPPSLPSPNAMSLVATDLVAWMAMWMYAARRECGSSPSAHAASGGIAIDERR